METDIVIVDTEETNALMRDIMETGILAEETKYKVFNMYTYIMEGIFLQCYYQQKYQKLTWSEYNKKINLKFSRGEYF